MPSYNEAEHIGSFSTLVGLLYVFNLIVGTGALALPKAFQNAGYLFSIFLLGFSAFASYVCATFVIESMAIANALKLLSSKESPGEGENEATDSDTAHRVGVSNQERLPGEEAFAIKRRVEVSEMAHMFAAGGRKGLLFTYFALSVYLLGDLAIYSATVPKSLMNIICSTSLNTSSPLDGNAPCHHTAGWPHFLTRTVIYRCCVLIFVSFCLPMVLVGMARTKVLQLATTASRWLALTLMIILASVQLVSDGPKARPEAVNPKGFVSLFGVAVYAFMCHHSIPGLVTPMRNKDFLSHKLLYVYTLVFLLYCTLSLTGTFAFEKVQDVYTLNFLHDEMTGGLLLTLCDYFLALFPVFTLTSSYIIVAITLSNNARVLARIIVTTLQASRSSNQGSGDEEGEALLPEAGNSSPQRSRSLARVGAEDGRNATDYSEPSLWKSILIPVGVVILPAGISLLTDNVLLLAGITGCYPGVGVQFIIPSLLILGARKRLKAATGLLTPRRYSSPFSHWAWPYATIGWALLAILGVTWNIVHLG